MVFIIGDWQPVLYRERKASLNTLQTYDYDFTIVMPCLNEQETIGQCVAQARDFLERHHLNGEVLVADNGSTDRSIELAQTNGARVISVAQPGYGSALRAGFAAARSQYIIMGDSDGNHDLSNLMPFVEGLYKGYDLVVGNRFAGGIEAGSMPWLRQYIGNPFLSFVGRLFFHTPVRDFNCGLRGIRKEALEQMQLHTTGMEFASEMIVKASLLNLKVVEVPTRQLPDAPGRESHLHPLRDGWRHLRFLLLYSPVWLFFYPGLVMLVLGVILSLRLLVGPINLGNGVVDFHSLIYAGTFSIIGLNLLSFSVITHVYALHHNLLPKRSNFSKYYRYFQLERGVLVGGLLLMAGILILITTVYLGLSRQFSELGSSSTIRLVYSSSLLMISGTQILFTSFVLSILGLKVT